MAIGNVRPAVGGNVGDSPRQCLDQHRRKFTYIGYCSRDPRCRRPMITNRWPRKCSANDQKAQFLRDTNEKRLAAADVSRSSREGGKDGFWRKISRPPVRLDSRMKIWTDGAWPSVAVRAELSKRKLSSSFRSKTERKLDEVLYNRLAHFRHSPKWARLSSISMSFDDVIRKRPNGSLYRLETSQSPNRSVFFNDGPSDLEPKTTQDVTVTSGRIFERNSDRFENVQWPVNRPLAIRKHHENLARGRRVQQLPEFVGFILAAHKDR